MSPRRSKLFRGGRRETNLRVLLRDGRENYGGVKREESRVAEARRKQPLKVALLKQPHKMRWESIPFQHRQSIETPLSNSLEVLPPVSLHAPKDRPVQRLQRRGLTGRETHHLDVSLRFTTRFEEFIVVDVRVMTIDKDDVLEKKGGDHTNQASNEINQSINRSVNQSISQPINQSVNQSIIQKSSVKYSPCVLSCLAKEILEHMP